MPTIVLIKIHKNSTNQLPTQKAKTVKLKSAKKNKSKGFDLIPWQLHGARHVDSGDEKVSTQW